MKKIRQHNLENLAKEKPINCIIVLLGIVFILISIFLRSNEILFTIFISIGASLLATVIVTYLNSKYLIRQSIINDMVNSYGLDGIYKTRADANADTNELLKKANTLDICAMGLKNFREVKGDMVLKRVSKGLKIKILTIDPNSSFLDQIDESENNARGATKKSIEELMNWVDRLKANALFDGQIELRIYDRYPYDFYFCIDGDVFTGPYHNKSSQQTITYKYLAKTLGANIFTDNFNAQWERAQHVEQ